jgi:hypothetical protein
LEEIRKKLEERNARLDEELQNLIGQMEVTEERFIFFHCQNNELKGILDEES